MQDELIRSMSISEIPKNLTWTNVSQYEILQTPKCLGPFKHCCIGQCRQEEPDFDTADFRDLLIALQLYINVEWCSLWFVGDSKSGDHALAAVCELSRLEYDIETCHFEFDLTKHVDIFGNQEVNYCRDLPNPDSFFLDDPGYQTIQMEMTSKDNAYCPKVRIKFHSPLKGLKRFDVKDGNVVKFIHDDEVGIILYSWGVWANTRQNMSEFMRDEFHPFYNSVRNNTREVQYVVMYREHEPQHFYKPGGIWNSWRRNVRECNANITRGMYDNYRNEETDVFLRSAFGANDMPIVRLFDALKPLGKLHYGRPDCTNNYSPWGIHVTWHGMIIGIRKFFNVKK
jgi:hypothetical protein